MTSLIPDESKSNENDFSINTAFDTATLPKVDSEHFSTNTVSTLPDGNQHQLQSSNFNQAPMAKDRTSQNQKVSTQNVTFPEPHPDDDAASPCSKEIGYEKL